MKSKALREKILPTHVLRKDEKASSSDVNNTKDEKLGRKTSSRGRSASRPPPTRNNRGRRSSSDTIHSGEVETVVGIRIVITALVLYAILFLVTISGLASTYFMYPLFPIQADWLDWSNAWVIGWIMNYYGTCLCFCGVVLSEEKRMRVGLAWCIGFLTLGSPIACMWMVVWLARRAGGNWTQ